MSPKESAHIEDDLGEDSIEATESVQQDASNSPDMRHDNMMHGSGQTDEERREIRRNQRLLLSKVVEAGQDLNIDEVRGENNEIFCNVYYPREAVLDGTNMHAIVGRATQKVDNLLKV